MKQFKRWMPNRAQLIHQRGLGWLRPLFAREELWRWSRKRVALGAAIGVWFGFMVPIFQIFFATIVAFFLRANLPAAAASTFVTNPFTFGPIYYLAYRLGSWVLGNVPDSQNLTAVGAEALQGSWWQHWDSIGASLATGLFIFAVMGSLIAYTTINGLWLFFIWRKRRKQIRDADPATINIKR